MPGERAGFQPCNHLPAGSVRMIVIAEKWCEAREISATQAFDRRFE
jgi:hypothetical protein